MSPLTEPTTLVLRKTWQPMDPDAAAYITAVEAADLAAGQSGGLEEKTKIAIDNFVLGCKADGIWNAIKASCILSGARTLNGALQPLVGTAPTNFNFVSGDYNRKTGLIGDGSTKYLDTNRAANSDGQNNSHLSAYAANLPPVGGYFWCLASTITGTGFKALVIDNRTPSGLHAALTNFQYPTDIRGTLATGFVGASRASSTSVTGRTNKATFSVDRTSTSPNSTNIRAFGTVGDLSQVRLAFYSIGESLDLALLDSRVTSLINAFAAAIP